MEMAEDGVMARMRPYLCLPADPMTSFEDLLLMLGMLSVSLSLVYGRHACTPDCIHTLFSFTVSQYALDFSKLEGQRSHPPLV